MYQHIAELSSTAGRNADGVPIGAINQTQLVAARAAVLSASTIYALCRDINGGDSFVDVSTLAVGGIADAFLPWGTDTNFSASDELWIAAEKDICAVYVDLTTPGMWTGVGLSVLESVDGESLVPVGNLVDDSNGLRAAAGVYKIGFDLNAANRMAITPVFGGTKRRYVVFRPNGFTDKTVSPKLRRLWLICADDGVTYLDILPQVSGSLTSNNFSIVPAQIFPVVGDALYYALPNLSLGIDDVAYRALPNVRSGIYEYLASDGTWKTLQGVSDPGNQLRNGPATLGASSNSYRLRWTMPTDWTARALTLTPATEQSAHWLRFRVTEVSIFGPVAPPLYRRRTRAYGPGNAAGIYHKVAASYSYVTFELGVPPATDMVLSWANTNNGDSRSITIPANTRSSSELVNGRLDFASALQIGAGEHLIPAIHVSGGNATDCHLTWL